jgi:tetratricopeptide (TPR) repeat protein
VQSGRNKRHLDCGDISPFGTTKIFMIRELDQTGGMDPKGFDHRVLLRSMEKNLSETEPQKNKKSREAQQLVHDAWEAANEERKAELMSRALDLNPTNVDALLYVLDSAALGPEGEIEALRNIVSRGEEDLGPTFKEFTGHFWVATETRPYMRARQRLAESLRDAGRLNEAIVEYEAMLILNPNDNQGVRYHLLPCYLIADRLKPARKLMTKYKEFEFSAVFAWCGVLERILSGHQAGAEKALKAARIQNFNIQPYIKGHRKLPRELPESYSIGSKEEALCFAHVLRAAWERHPDALKWLAAQKD